MDLAKKAIMEKNDLFGLQTETHKLNAVNIFSWIQNLPDEMVIFGPNTLLAQKSWEVHEGNLEWFAECKWR